MKEGEPGPLQALHGQHTVHGNKRSREAISSQEMHSVMKIDCCQRRCCSYFTPEQVEESRTEYWALRQADQRKWLRKTIRDAQGKGKEAPASEVPRVRRPTEAGVHAAKWLEDYIRFFADRQPDREELHLPACLTKDMLFKSYEDEMKQGKIRPVSRSRFHEIWLQQMPNVKIRKDPDDLPQCQTCATIQTGLMQLPCKQDREKFLNLRSTHLELQARCRKKYYKHIRKAAKDGLEGRHLSLIIDGMDQAKTRLPRFSVYSKADAHLHKMQQHVTGIKVHNTNQTYLMTWTDTLHPDANVTINALVHVLHDISKSTANFIGKQSLWQQTFQNGKPVENYQAQQWNGGDASKTTKPSVAFVNDLPTQQPSLQTATLELVTTLLEATEH
ncbi:hypothetical protein MAR_034088, partial [Mya arenaria]